MVRGTFRFPEALQRSAPVERWLRTQPGELGMLARAWFTFIRQCGRDVRELMHDNHPTACVGDAAFVYLAVFKAHVNVGFFHGDVLPDPAGLLQGTGRYMRHVKLFPGRAVDGASIEALITAAYRDTCARLKAEQ